tara:strand:+ start:4576 stop:5151 length:576 start_codon:yes stop_codon:yes gene_type:complete
MQEADTDLTDSDGGSTLFPRGNQDIHTTVLTIGGPGWTPKISTVVHLLSWVITVTLTASTMSHVQDFTEANGTAKSSSVLALIVQVFTVVAILVHAAFCNKEETWTAVILTSFLVTSVLLGLISNVSVFVYCMILGERSLWNISACTMISNVLSSSILLTFMAEWRTGGSVQFKLLERLTAATNRLRRIKF